MKRIALAACLLLTGSAQTQDIPLSKVLAPGEGWKPLTRHEFPSIAGLATDSRGLVYVSDPENKQIVRVDLDGKADPFTRLAEAPAGIAFDSEGRLYACQPEKGRIVRVEGPDKETIVAEGLKGARDLVVTRTGNIYCTVPKRGDAGEPGVYLVTRDGKRKTGAGLESPTGLVLWPHQGTLVVADHAGKALWAFRIKPDGSLVDGEPYYPLRVRKPQPSDAEGITSDAGGLVYATSQAGVQVFDPTGRLCGVLLRPGPGPHIAVTFAGPERDHLVLACGNKLYVRKLLMKGLK